MGYSGLSPMVHAPIPLLPVKDEIGRLRQSGALRPALVEAGAPTVLA
jgi:hypothetical protein